MSLKGVVMQIGIATNLVRTIAATALVAAAFLLPEVALAEGLGIFCFVVALVLLFVVK